MKALDKSKQEPGFQGLKFLSFVAVLFFVSYLYDKSKTYEAFHYFIKNTWSVLPVFLFVIILTAIINYYFPKQRIAKMLQGKSRFRTYTVSLLAGIISHGPVFVWYPLLKNLKDKGLQDGALVTFLYARSIKLTLLPVMIGFFGQLFSLVFMAYIAIAAILQGIIYELFFGDKTKTRAKN